MQRDRVTCPKSRGVLGSNARVHPHASSSDPALFTTSPFVKARILRVHSFNKYYFSTFHKEDPLFGTEAVTMDNYTKSLL